MLLKTTFATLVLAATILAEGNDSAAIDDVPRFTFYGPPGEREKIGASAVSSLLTWNSLSVTGFLNENVRNGNLIVNVCSVKDSSNTR